MNYCMNCGAKLEKRYHEQEKKEILYCPACKEFRFPIYNVAVSMIVMNRTGEKILLIKQYGRDQYILVAGYVNRGEDAEAAVIREVKEELGLTVHSMIFNHSHFFEPSNTLMLNFAVYVEEEEPQPNWEIDSYRFFTREGAREQVKRPSLAQRFLDEFLGKIENDKEETENS